MGIKLNQIHQIDCLKGLGRIPPDTVDLAFADPPFNIGYEYDVYDDRRKPDAYLDWSRQWISGVVRALKPTGTFWAAIGDEYAAEIKLIAQKEADLTCRSWVIWYYTFGVNCTKKFSRSHAHLFYFVKDPERFTFNEQAIRVPSARQLVYADRRANPKGRLPDDTWILRPQDLPDGFEPHEDTWYFPRVCGTFAERAGWHGCQMPEQLLGRIIRACSNPGDLVLDPFAGSGTTVAVAKKLDRRWLGFELSEEYVGRIKQRLREAKVGDPLEGSEEPLASAPATPVAGESPRAAKRAPASRAAEGAGLDAHRPDRSLGRIAVATGAISTAIAEAYLAACEGFSIDRVIADPELNSEFLKACRELGIAGRPVDWNHRLIGLRKGGKLSPLPKPKRTLMRREDMDDFIFASEIAWQLLSEKHEVSLDEILCDPDRAAEFDETASRFAPGWMPFHYRWGALRIRKEAKKKKEYAARLPENIRGARFKRRAVSVQDLRQVPVCEGLYLLQANGTNLYLGETYRLRERIEKQVRHLSALLAHLKLADLSAKDISIRLLPLREVSRHHRLGLQSRLMGAIKPKPLANAHFDKQAFLG